MCSWPWQRVYPIRGEKGIKKYASHSVVCYIDQATQFYLTGDRIINSTEGTGTRAWLRKTSEGLHLRQALQDKQEFAKQRRKMGEMPGGGGTSTSQGMKTPGALAARS